jgi:hypothetical protein
MNETPFNQMIIQIKEMPPKQPSPAAYALELYYRFNKWSTRVIKRGTEMDTAEVVKCKGFPDEVVLARAMWPDQARAVVEEHNASIARLCFRQDESEQ